ncbi:hypothetical protein L6452_07542 [Arctium lappa]|uniref:Uncharacterized protein n=1 Tax=Arctium lappa TaxID=4217 RepID=A0ACB9EKS1_ARCLA|nr:hypothetical protein L6452_07542 [Arctium lappa]
MSGDDWLTFAMADPHLVAELLLKLRLPLPPPSKRSRPSPPQSWTIHQRRSKTQPLLPTSNKSETPRASPSTPLSWSGGATSVSGGGGVPIVDVVDSTIPNLNRSVISRSKVTPPGDTTPTKRPRKKKTLVALKEEEALLIEEQKHLKRKLETLQATCEKQIKENESLKKMKLDIQVEPQEERQQRNNDFEERKDKLVLPDLNDDPAGEDVTVSY